MLPKTNTFVRKNVMIRQKYGINQNVRHSGKRGGKTDRKVTKNYVGEGFAARNVMPLTRKKTKNKKKTRSCE